MSEVRMSDARAIGLIFSMCIRIMGLLVVVAEHLVPIEHSEQRGFVRKQREWLEEQQGMLEVESMVNEAMEWEE